MPTRWRSTDDRAPFAVLLEPDDQDLPAPVTADVNRVGRPAGAPGHVGGDARAGFVRPAHGQVVDPGAGDLVVPRSDRAMDEADPPAIVGQVRGGEAGGQGQAQLGIARSAPGPANGSRIVTLPGAAARAARSKAR